MWTKFNNKAAKSFGKHVENLMTVTQRSAETQKMLSDTYRAVDTDMKNDMIDFENMIADAKNLSTSADATIEAVATKIEAKMAAYKKALADYSGMTFDMSVEERKTISEAVVCENKNKKCHKLTAAIANSYSAEGEAQLNSCAGANTSASASAATGGVGTNGLGLAAAVRAAASALATAVPC